MDNLTYDYGTVNGTVSNRLLNVSDSGDKTKGFVEPSSTTGNDYAYDANGNMVVDQNKGITAIAYNHLNLPKQVNKGATDYIVYTYDAGGRKLTQQVFGSTPKTTEYLAEYIYENNVLQFINTEEGRIVMTGATPEYQYHLKDHLGNVRTTFTTLTTPEVNTATYEDANLVAEMGKFLRIDKARRVYATLFDHTNGASPGYAERLNGSANEKFGIARSIAVSPGDTIKAEVYAKYVDTNTANWTAALNTLITQIASNTAGVVVDGTNYTSSSSSFPSTFLQGHTPNGTAPMAYLNWMVFDKNWVLRPSQSGYMQITTASREYGQDVTHERLFSPTITIVEPGYIYIYVSNDEAASPKEVYFDDFKVTQIKSPVIATDDYYPFGLTYNSYSRENNVPNKWKFQGQEHIDDLGLNWEAFKWRNHQADIGRFFNIDPLAEKYVYNSPFAFSENKVVAHVELEGLESITIKFQTFKNDWAPNGRRFSSSDRYDRTSGTLRLKVDLSSGVVSYKGSRNVTIKPEDIKVTRSSGGALNISASYLSAGRVLAGVHPNSSTSINAVIALNTEKASLQVNTSMSTGSKGIQMQTSVLGDYQSTLTNVKGQEENANPSIFGSRYLPGSNNSSANANFNISLFSDNTMSLDNISLNGGPRKDIKENNQALENQTVTEKK